MISDQTTQPIPCLWHPINVLFLDDNQGFLDSLALELNHSGQIMVTTNVDKAKRTLDQNQENIINRISEQLSDTEIDTYNEQFIDIEISRIKEMIYDENRFDFVPILIVDYQMPYINGVEVCRQLKNHKSIHKIMLTAEADKDTAIEAFNEGIIDHFLMKQSETLYEDLVTAINQQKQQYFNALSKPILDSPIAKNLQTVLNNTHYIQVFNQVLKDSQAVEYYLLDTSGSFLFLDGQANPYWLIIRTESDFNNQIAMLEGLEVSDRVKQALRKRDNLLFLLAESEFQKPAKSWEEYLFQTHPIDNGLWYATARGPIKSIIDWSNIRAFRG